MSKTNLPAAAAAVNDNALRPWKAVDWSALDTPEAPAPVKPRRPVLWHLLDQPEA